MESLSRVGFFDILGGMQPTKRDFELAKIFLNHSLKVKPKEKVLITTSDSGAFPLVKAVYMETLKLGAYPEVDTQIDMLINRSRMGGFAYQFYSLANEWQMNYVPKEIIEAKIEWADAYVRIVTDDNLRELNQIEPEKLTHRMKLMRPLFDKMIDSDRWVLTYYPSTGMAQEAGVSLDWLTDFYYESALVDYGKMKKNLKKLEKILDEGNEIRVIGKDTDLRFSIKGRMACACYGERNIPDGEVFLAPLHKTLEGKVYFDFPSMALGREVRGVRLEFKKGKVVNASAEHGDETLQKMLETDEGARYVGEFAIGANYNIVDPMKNTLFDEKIGGTIHMALGRAYKEKRGGGTNESAIHWDIVKNMREKGSKVEVDGKVVLESGKIKV